MRRLLAPSIAGAFALGACSLLTDTSDLTGGSVTSTTDSGDAPADGRPGEDGSVVTDGSVDPETGTLVDASPPDAADAADGAVPCPSGTMVLCDNFDRNTLLGPWSSQKVTGGASVAIFSDGSRQALRAHMPPPPGVGSTIEAYLSKDFPSNASACFYDFDVRYSTLPTTDPVEFAAIYWYQGGVYQAVYLALRPTKITVTEEDGASNNYVFSDISLAAGAWQHVSIEAHVAGQLIVKVEGVTVLSKSLATFVKVGRPYVVAGISYAATPSTLLDVDMDNVVFRATP